MLTDSRWQDHFYSRLIHVEGAGSLFKLSLSCLFFGKAEVECRPFIGLSFRPRSATVSHDDATYIGQSYANSLELLVTMQALKHPKQFVRMACVETNTIVPNKNDKCFLLVIQGADFDEGGIPWLRVLQRAGN